MGIEALEACPKSLTADHLTKAHSFWFGGFQVEEMIVLDVAE